MNTQQGRHGAASRRGAGQRPAGTSAPGSAATGPRRAPRARFVRVWRPRIASASCGHGSLQGCAAPCCKKIFWGVFRRWTADSRRSRGRGPPPSHAGRGAGQRPRGRQHAAARREATESATRCACRAGRCVRIGHRFTTAQLHGSEAAPARDREQLTPQQIRSAFGF